MLRKLAVSLGLCLAAAVALAQGDKDKVVASLDADGVQRVRIVGGSYFFKPGHIVVKVNVPVELLASRESGITPHNLLIKAPEAGLDVEVDLGTEAKKIAFKPTAVGKYPIYCSKKLPFMAGHREKGMEGVLEVVP
ncbi:MAG TPA: quinol oxidase [Burkholderiales bacterium]|jgi:plastocyanin domain-containing protein|nr:quinol oxidase [Burkholderiales bacterium]